MKDHLVALIETKLAWGKGGTWGNKDFEELGERIFNTTNKRLSVTTLKRIWGRTEWVANPSVATLDILSEFVGYENWRAFLHANKQKPYEQKVVEKSKSSKIWILLLALILIGSFFGFFWKTDSKNDNYKEGTDYKPEDFTFSGESTTTSLPNSVVFKFDVSAADENAKIEIQQDWDERKRVTVNKEDSVSTSIYYWPGYFKSKLVVNNTIVVEKDIFIPTQDWLGVIESDSIPLYLNNKEFRKGNILQVTPEILTQYNIDPSASMTVAGFYKVMDFGNLYTDEFEMSTSFRNDFKAGVSVCQRVKVAVMHEDGPIILLFSDKGCISDISLFAFGRQIDGKKTDLSGFGVDFNDYVDLKCVSSNQKLNILIDNKSVFSFDVPESSKKIIGISILFEGAGSVRNVEFKKRDEIIYTSDF